MGYEQTLSSLYIFLLFLNLSIYFSVFSAGAPSLFPPLCHRCTGAASHQLLLHFCLLHLFQCSPFSRWLTTQPSLSHPLSLPPSASVSHSILVITRTSVRSLWLLTSILSHHQSNRYLLQHPSLSINWPGSNDPVVALSTEPPSGVPHPHHSAFHSNPLYLSVQSSGNPQLENGNFHSPHMHWHTLLLSSFSSSSLSRSGQRCVWFPPSAI